MSGGVRRYEIAIGSKQCQAQAGPATPSCTLTGLAAGTQYEASAYSCGDENQCGRSTLGPVNTLSDGMFLTIINERTFGFLFHFCLSMCFTIYLFFALVPKEFTLEEAKPSSVIVNIVGVDGNPDLILYKATAEGGGRKHDCRVARGTVPLRCKLTGLQSSTGYTISVRSCLSGNRCGNALTQQLATKPQGMVEGGFHRIFKVDCINAVRFRYSAAERKGDRRIVHGRDGDVKCCK